MRLYVLRHGQASYQAPSDAQRELTERGRIETQQIVSNHLANLQRPLHIASSPYVRAQQTAAIAAEVLAFSEQEKQAIASTAWPELRSESPTEKTLERLYHWFNERADADLLLVSHQPLVGQLIDTLADLTPGRYMMGTSALACLEGQDCLPGCMELQALHQP